MRPLEECIADILTNRRLAMAKLIYSAIMSLDGYIEDRDGKFDWAVPDEVVHKFINNLERTASTHLYGRRMYETMMGWETDPSLAAESPILPSLPSCGTSPRYGRRLTRSSTPRR
jgi:hypothetical protein